MTRTRTTFEVLVGTHVSPATLATFPVRLVPTALPRKSVHRLRVGADRSIADIVARLTEHHVELLEIRKCPQPPRERPVPPPCAATEEQPCAEDVVVPLAAAPRSSARASRRRGNSGGPLRGAAVLPFGR